MSSFFLPSQDQDEDSYISTSIDYSQDSHQRLDFDSLTQCLADRDLSDTQREDLCRRYIQEDSLTLLECINNIFVLFLENNLSYLRDALIHFSKMSFLPFPIRIKACQSIVEVDNEVKHLFESNQEISLRLQLDVCEDVITRPSDPEFNHTLLFEILVSLLSFDSTRALSHISTILTNPFLEEKYRFTLFLYFKATQESFVPQLVVSIYNHFFNATHLVLLSQLICSSGHTLLTSGHSGAGTLPVDHLVQCIQTDRDAAEICDFLLEAKLSDEWTSFAKQRLQQIQGVSKNVFESSQNLHEVSVDIESFVEKMMDFDTTSIATLILRFPDLESIFHRISIDNALYSTKAINISTLLGKCWSCIQQHESRLELEKRFEQELLDMKDTCTSGHLVRLMNVFSGWMDGIKLDAKLEIQSVIFYRLQKMIDKLSDDDKDKIIDELGSVEITDGVAQMAIQHHLFRPIAELHDEMQADYKGIIDDQKFAEYFRQALLDFTVEK